MADGRAMLSAVAGVHADCDRARSSSKLAYADGFAPSLNTSSSQARSRSRARAAAAYQTSGLNQ